MTSLRTNIAVLLVVAILAVVGLATLAASRALRPPEAAATIEPIAAQIALLARLAESDPEAMQRQGALLQDRPAAGRLAPKMTKFLLIALARAGEDRPLVVTRIEGVPALTASVDLGGGHWLVTQLPDFSPPDDQWVIFAIWLAMIVVGSVLVALYAARRLSRPLALLESAASRIGADAMLSHLPETGPAEVRATARALNRLSDRLARAMESRMRLVAAAGHDLRTPMTRMRLRAEFIEDDGERGKWLADLEELDQIADSAIRLVREEAARDEAEGLALDALLTEIAGELTELDMRVRLQGLAPLRVKAGPIALKRALRNLIVNAATHGGGAEVALLAEAGKAVVRIRDAGPGIPEELLGQVFEPFFRVDPARRKTMPGAGLGLAIAREIIERLGGRIAVRNLTPRGLLQEITLPQAL